MPRFLVIHHAPGVSLEDFHGNAADVVLSRHATFVFTYVNLTAGTIVNIYDGESAEAVGRELERIGFPYDEIQKVQFSASMDDLRDIDASSRPEAR